MEFSLSDFSWHHYVLCGGALMFYAGYTIDKAATRPENILMIYVPIVLMRAVGIGRPLFRYLERLVSHNWILRVTSSLRRRLFILLKKILRQSDQPFKQEVFFLSN